MKTNQKGISVIEIMFMMGILIFLSASFFSLTKMGKRDRYIREIANEIKSNNPNSALTEMAHQRYSLKTKEQRDKFCDDPIAFLLTMKDYQIIPTFKTDKGEYIVNTKDVSFDRLNSYSENYCKNQPNSPILTFQAEINPEANNTMDEFKKPENKWNSTEAL